MSQRESARKTLGAIWHQTKLALRRFPMQLRWGGLRRLQPVSRVFGFDRGLPIDRYYIEQFLSSESTAIRGRVLEIADNHYTKKFGGDHVTVSDVLHAIPGNPEATIVGDLVTGQSVPSNAFDCIICTQTLPFIYDYRTALQTLHRALKPGGVLLLTFAGISQISRYDMDRWGDYWRFTSLSARRLLEEFFPPENLRIKSCGNVLAAVSFLHGLAKEELKKRELDFHDPDYELLVTVAATKQEAERDAANR